MTQAQQALARAMALFEKQQASVPIEQISAEQTVLQNGNTVELMS